MTRLALVLLTVALLAGCGRLGGRETVDPQAAAELSRQARALFGSLPSEAANPDNPITEAKTRLGRMLYYEPRLSRSHELSCNSCHQLDRFGVDNEPTSPGHRGQRGDRNSPTTYNAAFHLAQFWDGREADVEAQAGGPMMNPVEMAMSSVPDVEKTLRSIPGYGPLFAAAYPGETQPVTFDNATRAIAAFERRLVTPSPFDRFVEGDLEALTAREQRGMRTFIAVGCTTCHNGPAVGGSMFMKLGLVNPYPNADPGRFNVTGVESDRQVFKVPSLRNVAETGPWFHDGSVTELAEAVRLMGWHQLGRRLEDAQVTEIVAFLKSLTGKPDRAYIAKPTLPPSSDRTPPPDPS